MPYEVPPLPYAYDALRAHHRRADDASASRQASPGYVDKTPTRRWPGRVGRSSCRVGPPNLEILPETSEACATSRRPRKPPRCSGRSWGPGGGGEPSGALADAIATRRQLDELKKLSTTRASTVGSGDVARPRRHRTGVYSTGPGFTDQQTPTRRCSASTCGSTRTTSTHQNRRPITWRPGGNVVNWSRAAEVRERGLNATRLSRTVSADDGLRAVHVQIPRPA